MKNIQLLEQEAIALVGSKEGYKEGKEERELRGKKPGFSTNSKINSSKLGSWAEEDERYTEHERAPGFQNKCPQSH